MAVRSRGDRFLVNAMKIGSTPNGSTTTSKVANAARKNFNSASSIADKMGELSHIVQSVQSGRGEKEYQGSGLVWDTGLRSGILQLAPGTMPASRSVGGNDAKSGKAQHLLQSILASGIASLFTSWSVSEGV
jgi:hypothetical protein